MDTYYIYKASNSENDKVYIGCTKNYERRIADHLRCSPTEDCTFHRAIEEIGRDKFKFEIIDSAEGIEEGHRLEREYIEKYDSFQNGYNSTIGGFAASPWNIKPIVCLDLDGNYVREYDSAGAAKADGFPDSNVLECCKGLAFQCKGYLFMYKEDYEQNGPRKYRKPPAHNRTSVVQCDLSGNFINRFDSVLIASEETGVPRPQISANITGKHKTACGYIFVYEKDFPIKDISVHVRKKKGKRVAQVNAETGEIIKIYDRISDAGNELGVSYKVIHKVVDKDGYTAYGFKWISQ